jgi:hypothetical protein
VATVGRGGAPAIAAVAFGAAAARETAAVEGGGAGALAPADGVGDPAGGLGGGKEDGVALVGRGAAVGGCVLTGGSLGGGFVAERVPGGALSVAAPRSPSRRATAASNAASSRWMMSSTRGGFSDRNWSIIALRARS